MPPMVYILLVKENHIAIPILRDIGAQNYHVSRRWEAEKYLVSYNNYTDYKPGISRLCEEHWQWWRRIES